MFKDVESFQVNAKAKYPKIKLNEHAYCTTHKKDCFLLVSRRNGDKKLAGLVLGPPCVAHSKMGLGKGFKDGRAACHGIGKQLIVDGGYDFFLLENVDLYPMQEECKSMPSFDVRICETTPLHLGYKYGRDRNYAIGLNKATMKWVTDKPLTELWADFAREPAVNSALAYFVMEDADIKALYDWFDPKDPEAYLNASSMQHKAAYQRDAKMKDRVLWDLMQNPAPKASTTGEPLPSRRRGSRVDGSLPCVTTNSGQLFSQFKNRILMPEELLNAHGVPVLLEGAPTNMHKRSLTRSLTQMRKRVG